MEEKIKAKLEEIRPMLQADGGDLEVVNIDGTNVTLRLKGACGGCPHATMTIKQGIQRILREQVDELRSWLGKGPPSARVTKVTESYCEREARHDAFEILY